jgi:hypothetical protein
MLAVVAVLVGAGAGHAADVTIAIQGPVVVVTDPAGVLGGTIQAGDIISGTYTYNTATPDANALPTVGDYWHTTSPYGLILTAGGHVFRTARTNVQFLVEIVNDHGTPASDHYLLRSYTNRPLANGAVVEHIAWQLDDPTLAALSSEALPVGAPVLTDWRQSTFGLTITGCPAEDFNGFSCDGSFDFFIYAYVRSATVIP